jgi:hypothetical protein
MFDGLSVRQILHDPRVLALVLCVLVFGGFAGYKMVGALGGQRSSHAPDLPAPAFINHQIAPLVERGALTRARLPEDAYRQVVALARPLALQLIHGRATRASLRAAAVSPADATAALSVFAGQSSNSAQLRSGFNLQQLNVATASFSADFVAVKVDNSPVYGQIVVSVTSPDNWASVRLTGLRVYVQSS